MKLWIQFVPGCNLTRYRYKLFYCYNGINSAAAGIIDRILKQADAYGLPFLRFIG